jgi:hypothetical protein
VTVAVAKAAAFSLPDNLPLTVTGVLPHSSGDTPIYGDAADPAELDRPVTLSFAKCKESKSWRAVPGTVATLLTELCGRHNQFNSKNGSICLYASLDGERRISEAVRAIEGVVVDSDSGETSIADATRSLQKAEHTYALFTSPSHSDWRKPKFRIVLPLAEPWSVPLDLSLARRKELWHATYVATVKPLGISYDASAARLIQAHNCPRHRMGAPYHVHIGLGRCLRLPKVKLPPERAKLGFIEPGGAERTRPPLYKCRHVGQMVRDYGDRMLLGDFIRDVGWDIFTDHGEKLIIRCPLEYEHSEIKENDPACAVFSPDEGRVAIRCLHDHGGDVISTTDMLTAIGARLKIDVPTHLRPYILETHDDD